MIVCLVVGCSGMPADEFVVRAAQSLIFARLPKTENECPMLTIITGQEINTNPTEAVGALVEYYEAFNGRNMELMELNWIDSDEASIDYPLGGHQHGWKSISRIYDHVFRLKAKLNIELQDFAIHEAGESFLCVGRELIRFWRDNATFEVGVRSSRWFTRKYGRWRQFHYHGSIDDARHLQAFQAWTLAQSQPPTRTVDSVELTSAPR